MGAARIMRYCTTARNATGAAGHLGEHAQGAHRAELHRVRLVLQEADEGADDGEAVAPEERAALRRAG